MLFVISTIVIFNLPDNILKSKNFQYELYVQSISPQGWGFFTRNPKEEMVDIFEINGKKLKKISVPNMSFENRIGISRISRRVGYDISMLLGSFPKVVAWKTIPEMPKFAAKDSVVNLNVDSNKLYCLKNHQKYLLVKYNSTPWTWLEFKENGDKTQSFMSLTVKINYK